MTEEVTDTWLVGVVAHDEALSSVRVHAGYVAAGPTSGRDHRLQVRLRHGASTAPVFPDPVDSAALLQVEEHLVGRLAGLAVLVAVLTVPGFRDLVFHTAEPDRCVDRLANLDGPAGADRIVVDAPELATDPAWSLYRSLFADAVPADVDRRRIADAATRTGTSPPECVVEHRFSFPGLDEADRAAAALREVGLEVVFAGSDDLDEASPPRFVVTETETLTQIDMARSRDALAGFASSWGGDYLGWTVPERTSPPPVPGQG